MVGIGWRVIVGGHVGGGRWMAGCAVVDGVDLVLKIRAAQQVLKIRSV